MKNSPEDLNTAVLPQLLCDINSHICAGEKFLPFIHRRLCLNQSEVWWFTDWQAPPKDKALKLYSMLMVKGKNAVYQLFLALLDSSRVLPNHYDLATTLKKTGKEDITGLLGVDIRSNLHSRQVVFAVHSS